MPSKCCVRKCWPRRSWFSVGLAPVSSCIWASSGAACFMPASMASASADTVSSSESTWKVGDWLLFPTYKPGRFIYVRKSCLPPLSAPLRSRLGSAQQRLAHELEPVVAEVHVVAVDEHCRRTEPAAG